MKKFEIHENTHEALRQVKDLVVKQERFALKSGERILNSAKK